MALLLDSHGNRYSTDKRGVDKAAGIYEAIVADFPDEAEAYWGLVLCKYGIEYVDDPATGKKIPTCHRSSFDSIMEDIDFEQALENADAVQIQIGMLTAAGGDALDSDSILSLSQVIHTDHRHLIDRLITTGGLTCFVVIVIIIAVTVTVIT